MTLPSRSRSVIAFVLFALLAAPRVGAAQSVSACRAPENAVSLAATAGAWQSPLDRPVTLRAQQISMRTALDSVAALAHIRLAYSRELLPPDHRVCIDRAGVPAGRLFAELLTGSDLDALALGGDQVVLQRRAPALAAMVSTPRPDTTVRVQTLAPVVATARVASIIQPELTVSRSVIDGADLAQRDASSLASALNGVPGVWAWNRAPNTFLSQFASVRGASSFGASSPKTYIDGVEVANPMVATLLAGDNIERIEFIRGPQGGALYGADALSGVVNITTRHDGSATGRLDVRLRSNAGVVQSDYSQAAQLTQDHSLSIRAGTGFRSLGLALTNTRIGAYIPGAASQQTSALATGRLINDHSMFGLTARFANATGSTTRNPLLTDLSISGASPDSAGRQSLGEYTVGLSAQFFSGDRWTHSLTLGLDGYRLSGIAQDALPLSTAVVESFSATPTAADRGSFRASSVYKLGESARGAASVTFALEHTALRQVGRDSAGTSTSPLLGKVLAEFNGPSQGAPPPFDDHGPRGPGESMPDSAIALQGPPIAPVAGDPQSVSNTGITAQFDASLRKTLYVTGGLRFERTSGLEDESRLVALPMLGTSVVASRGDLQIKLRGAYGKGIRSQQVLSRAPFQFDDRIPRASRMEMMPEEQRGTEFGIDLAYGNAVSLQVTRFDQLASGLVQQVSLPSHDGRTISAIANVGEIANRGWEIEPRATVGSLSLGGMLSLVDSRVRRIAAAYTGDLRSGDRMLGIPALTAGLTFGYHSARTNASLGVSHARDWINYDVLALERHSERGFIATLRDYWRHYSGVTQLRARASRDLGRGLALVLTGNNLLGQQRGAPDNATVLPGRTIILGVRMVF